VNPGATIVAASGRPKAYFAATQWRAAGSPWEHRALDGALAAQLLGALKRRIEGV
jgi:hypothetical protein